MQKLAQAEIEARLAELPKPLREEARKLPLTFEPAPDAGLQTDGIQLRMNTTATQERYPPGRHSCISAF